MCMCPRQRRRKDRERGSHLGVGFCLGCSCVLSFVFHTLRTQMLQKMGKVDDTKDESFQRYVVNFNAQHVSCTLPYLVFCTRLDSAVLVGSLPVKWRAGLHSTVRMQTALACVWTCYVNLATHGADPVHFPCHSLVTILPSVLIAHCTLQSFA